jgi:hypothetical protein
MFVLVSTEWLMMYPANDNLASCKIHAVIHFRHAKHTSPAEIHCELCATVYSQYGISEGTVRQWCRMFEDRWTNVHDEERSGQTYVMSDYLVQFVDQKVCERCISQFHNVLVNLHKFHALFSTRVRLGYHNHFYCLHPVLLSMTNNYTYLQSMHKTPEDGPLGPKHVV